MEQAAHNLGVLAFQVTVHHANDIQNWLFMGPMPCDLTTRLSPFTVTLPGTMLAKALMHLSLDFENNQDHTTLVKGNAALTAANAQSLRSANTCVSVDFDELEDGLRAFLGLLGAVLGTNHPLVHSCQRALCTHRGMHLTFWHSISLRLGTQLGAATVMCHFHLEIRCWVKEQWNLTTVGFVMPPDLSHHFRIFDRLGNLEWLPDTQLVPQLQALRATTPSPAVPRAPTADKAGLQLETLDQGPEPQPGCPTRGHNSCPADPEGQV